MIAKNWNRTIENRQTAVHNISNAENREKRWDSWIIVCWVIDSSEDIFLDIVEWKILPEENRKRNRFVRFNFESIKLQIPNHCKRISVIGQNVYNSNEFVLCDRSESAFDLWLLFHHYFECLDAKSELTRGVCKSKLSPCIHHCAEDAKYYSSNLAAIHPLSIYRQRKDNFLLISASALPNVACFFFHFIFLIAKKLWNCFSRSVCTRIHCVFMKKERLNEIPFSRVYILTRAMQHYSVQCDTAK